MIAVVPSSAGYYRFVRGPPRPLTAVSCLPDDRVGDLFRRFGAREDVNLDNFYWKLVQTDDRPHFGRAGPSASDPARIRSLVREAEQCRHSYLEGRFGAEGLSRSSGATRSCSATTPRRSPALYDPKGAGACCPVARAKDASIPGRTRSPIPCSSGDSPAWTAIGRISSASAFTMHITEPFANT